MIISTRPVSTVTVRTRHRRLTQPQSKAGCFTCRARRKKCDEQKPACQRCVSSGRICEGYRSQEIDPVALYRTLPSRVSTSDDPHDAHFSRLGHEVLLQQVCLDSLATSADIWTTVLPQLNVVNTCVNAAVTCLGSVYDTLVLRHDLGMDLVVDRHYRTAISLLRAEIVRPAHGKAALFLACVVLAAVEALQGRLINAMVHVRGAFQVLRTYAACKTDGDEALYRIAQALDIQTATYALSQPPDLPPTSMNSSSSSSIIQLIPYKISIDDLHSEIFTLLHTCYHCCFEASKYKYLAPEKIPQQIILKQGRHIALLSQWTAWLSSSSAPLSRDTNQSLTSSHLILKLQCISAIIYLSSILNPFEKSYDSYTNFFTQIIEGATSLLNNPHQPQSLNLNLNNNNTPSHRFRFRILSPLSHPLYLTSMKCRNIQLRRQSIRLLGYTGTEGPWNSSILVSVATRVAELEEEEAEEHNNTNIPERARIHGSGILSETTTTTHGGGFVEAQFSRCVNIERMLVGSVGWGDESNWEIWTEKLPIRGRETEREPIK